MMMVLNIARERHRALAIADRQWEQSSKFWCLVAWRAVCSRCAEYAAMVRSGIQWHKGFVARAAWRSWQRHAAEFKIGREEAIAHWCLFTSRLLFKAWRLNAWEEANTGPHYKQQTQRKAWVAWLQYLAFRQSQTNNDKLGYRLWVRLTQYFSLKAWQRTSTHRLQQAEAWRRVGQQWSRYSMLAALQAWQGTYLWCRQLSVVIRRWSHVALLRSLATWRERVTRDAHDRRIVTTALGHLMHGMVARSLVKWRTVTTEWRRIRLSLHAAEVHHLKFLAFQCLQNWSWYLSAMRGLYKAVRAWTNYRLQRGFRQWLNIHVEEFRTRQLVLIKWGLMDPFRFLKAWRKAALILHQDALSIQAADQKGRAHRVSLALQRWLRWAGLQGKLNHAVDLWMHLGLGKAWRAWQGTAQKMAAQRRLLESVLRHMRHVQWYGMFVRWLGVTRAATMGSQAEQQGHQQWVQTQHRVMWNRWCADAEAMRTLKTCLRTWNQHSLLCAMNTWWAFLAQSVVATKVASQWLLQDMARKLRFWRGLAADLSFA